MNPTRILELANAFWGSAALLAANDCGLFAALSQGPLTAADTARRADLPLRTTQMLLDALVSLQLITKANEHYSNTVESQSFLVPGQPGSLAQALRYNAGLFSAWGQLAVAIKTNKPVVPSPTYLGHDAERTRAFVLGMHGRALGMGPAMVQSLNLAEAQHLVDVGGGPGTLSVLLCQRYPNLRATVVEVPAVAAVGRELVAQAGLSDRVRFNDGDAFVDSLGDGYDAALVSGLLHREPETACAGLCKKLFAALKPSAPAYLIDVMREASGVAPTVATLFALNMLLTSERGGCHTDAAHVAWLTEAGFIDPRVTRLPAPMVHTIVQARKPA